MIKAQEESTSEEDKQDKTKSDNTVTKVKKENEELKMKENAEGTDECDAPEIKVTVDDFFPKEAADLNNASLRTTGMDHEDIKLSEAVPTDEEIVIPVMEHAAFATPPKDSENINIERQMIDEKHETTSSHLHNIGAVLPCHTSAVPCDSSDVLVCDSSAASLSDTTAVVPHDALQKNVAVPQSGSLHLGHSKVKNLESSQCDPLSAACHIPSPVENSNVMTTMERGTSMENGTGTEESGTDPDNCIESLMHEEANQPQDEKKEVGHINQEEDTTGGDRVHQAETGDSNVSQQEEKESHHDAVNQDQDLAPCMTKKADDKKDVTGDQQNDKRKHQQQCTPCVGANDEKTKTELVHQEDAKDKGAYTKQMEEKQASGVNHPEKKTQVDKTKEEAVVINQSEEANKTDKQAQQKVDHKIQGEKKTVNKTVNNINQEEDGENAITRVEFCSQECNSDVQDANDDAEVRKKHAHISPAEKSQNICSVECKGDVQWTNENMERKEDANISQIGDSHTTESTEAKTCQNTETTICQNTENTDTEISQNTGNAEAKISQNAENADAKISQNTENTDAKICLNTEYKDDMSIQNIKSIKTKTGAESEANISFLEESENTERKGESDINTPIERLNTENTNAKICQEKCNTLVSTPENDSHQTCSSLDLGQVKYEKRDISWRDSPVAATSCFDFDQEAGEVGPQPVRDLGTGEEVVQGFRNAEECSGMSQECRDRTSEGFDGKEECQMDSGSTGQVAGDGHGDYHSDGQNIQMMDSVDKDASDDIESCDQKVDKIGSHSDGQVEGDGHRDDHTDGQSNQIVHCMDIESDTPGNEFGSIDQNDGQRDYNVTGDGQSERHDNQSKQVMDTSKESQNIDSMDENKSAGIIQSSSHTDSQSRDQITESVDRNTANDTECSDQKDDEMSCQSDGQVNKDEHSKEHDEQDKQMDTLDKDTPAEDIGIDRQSQRQIDEDQDTKQIMATTNKDTPKESDTGDTEKLHMEEKNINREEKDSQEICDAIDIDKNLLENTSENTSENTPRNIPENMPENVPENTPELPENTPGDTPENTPEDMPENPPDNTPEDMPENPPDNTPENMPGNTSEKIPDNTPEDMPENISENLPENTPENIPENIPEKTSEDIPENILEDMPENAPGDMPENIPENMHENILEDTPNTPENLQENTPKNPQENPAADDIGKPSTVSNQASAETSEAIEEASERCQVIRTPCNEMSASPTSTPQGIERPPAHSIVNPGGDEISPECHKSDQAAESACRHPPIQPSPISHLEDRNAAEIPDIQTKTQIPDLLFCATDGDGEPIRGEVIDVQAASVSGAKSAEVQEPKELSIFTHDENEIMMQSEVKSREGEEKTTHADGVEKLSIESRQINTTEKLRKYDDSGGDMPTTCGYEINTNANTCNTETPQSLAIDDKKGLVIHSRAGGSDINSPDSKLDSAPQDIGFRQEDGESQHAGVLTDEEKLVLDCHSEEKENCDETVNVAFQSEQNERSQVEKNVTNDQPHLSDDTQTINIQDNANNNLSDISAGISSHDSHGSSSCHAETFARAEHGSGREPDNDCFLTRSGGADGGAEEQSVVKQPEEDNTQIVKRDNTHESHSGEATVTVTGTSKDVVDVQYESGEENDSDEDILITEEDYAHESHSGEAIPILASSEESEIDDENESGEEYEINDIDEVLDILSRQASGEAAILDDDNANTNKSSKAEDTVIDTVDKKFSGDLAVSEVVANNKTVSGQENFEEDEITQCSATESEVTHKVGSTEANVANVGGDAERKTTIPRAKTQENVSISDESLYNVSKTETKTAPETTPTDIQSREITDKVNIIVQDLSDAILSTDSEDKDINRVAEDTSDPVLGTLHSQCSPINSEKDKQEDTDDLDSVDKDLLAEIEDKELKADINLKTKIDIEEISDELVDQSKEGKDEADQVIKTVITEEKKEKTDQVFETEISEEKKEQQTEGESSEKKDHSEQKQTFVDQITSDDMDAAGNVTESGQGSRQALTLSLHGNEVSDRSAGLLPSPYDNVDVQDELKRQERDGIEIGDGRDDDIVGDSKGATSSESPDDLPKHAKDNVVAENNPKLVPEVVSAQPEDKPADATDSGHTADEATTSGERVDRDPLIKPPTLPESTLLRDTPTLASRPPKCSTDSTPEKSSATTKHRKTSSDVLDFDAYKLPNTAVRRSSIDGSSCMDTQRINTEVKAVSKMADEKSTADDRQGLDKGKAEMMTETLIENDSLNPGAKESGPDTAENNEDTTAKSMDTEVMEDPKESDAHKKKSDVEVNEAVKKLTQVCYVYFQKYFCNRIINKLKYKLRHSY